MKPKENLEKSSELKYQNKDAGIDTSVYDRVFNELKKLYT